MPASALLLEPEEDWAGLTDTFVSLGVMQSDSEWLPMSSRLELGLHVRQQHVAPRELANTKQHSGLRMDATVVPAAV